MGKKPTATDEQPSKIGRPKKRRPTKSIRVDRDVAKMVLMLAIKRGIDSADLASTPLRDWVRPLYEAEVGPAPQE